MIGTGTVTVTGGRHEVSLQHWYFTWSGTVTGPGLLATGSLSRAVIVTFES